MRSGPFDRRPGGFAPREADDPLELTGGLPPPDGHRRRYPDEADADQRGWYHGARDRDDDAWDDEDPPAPGPYSSNLPVAWRPSRWRWVVRGLAAVVMLVMIAIGWLIFTAPLSKSLEPLTPPSITLLAADGTPIARRGATIGKPVDAATLPPHVTQAFLAIEDRRFFSHWGVDPWGITRAMLHNLAAGGLREGGSTITQQLAKNAFLDSDRTAGRKLREALIAFWLEAWLTKNEILSRYLSNVYFGDNVYGLSAAAKHYFSTTPDRLSIGQAAMLAGLVKAPSRLAPTGNLSGARARQAVVVGAMVRGGFLSKAEAADVSPARLRPDRVRQLPDGTYFADWVLPAARDQAGAISTETRVTTTLDARLQRAAERAVRRAGLKKAQVALVAMRPDGRIVAMVGGKSYADSPFNRATQARRQPGSAFKLFVYLAALRSGLTPDSIVDDSPVTVGNWSPRNSDGRYRGAITLREAFARSSNVAAARLTQKVGVRNVIRAARDLGISTDLPNEATIALGTASSSLLELTAAYAAIAADRYPVRPHGLTAERERGWIEALGDRDHPFGERIHDEMLDLLAASVETGTGRQAALSIDSYGKTGTSQDNRDALFMGFAEDLVVGVWVGNDDNSPNPGLSGGGIPARIWRDFMGSALGVGAAVRAPAVDPDAIDQPEGVAPDDPGDVGDSGDPGDTGRGDNGGIGIEGSLSGFGLDLKLGRDGTLSVNRVPREPGPPPPEPRDRPPRPPQ
ncbi:MAG: penicillin-binding protein [Sphingomonas sp. 28-62-20]|uniref:transglycosylase domain-containing protein n=1 Tax=Sphingomonas sp. 28-62-20 TaxID=1970433 RepID=UPI000BCA8201|nr:MAG: penicillin-binding protein [Sphingomonas sp. 28-62-20]